MRKSRLFIYSVAVLATLLLLAYGALFWPVPIERTLKVEKSPDGTREATYSWKPSGVVGAFSGDGAWVYLTVRDLDTVTKARLDAKATEHAAFTFPDQTYYVGSEGGYDYFVIRRGMVGSTSRYRVLESEGAVTNRFSVTKDETRWRGYGMTGIVVTNAAQIVR